MGTTQVRAQETEGVVLGVEQDILVEKKIVNNPNFRFGKNIVLSDDLMGDTYVAGAMIRIDGTIDGDLLVAGADVTINGDVTQDLRVVGGNVKINGSINRNISVVGGEVTFGPDSKVNGSVVGGGGNSDFGGSILGGTWFGSGNAILASDHGDEVNVWAGSVQLLPSANIEGDLNVQLDEQGIFNDQQGKVRGKKNIKVFEPDEKMIRAREESKRAMRAFNMGGKVVGLLMSLFSGAVLLYLFPKSSSQLVEKITKDPMASVGWGFVKLIMTPIAVIFLMVTVVGLPLSGLVFIGYLASLLVAKWIAALALGEFLQKKYAFDWMKGSAAKFMSGLVLISLIGLIPVLGFFVKFIAMLMGLGALLMWIKDVVRPTAK